MTTSRDPEALLSAYLADGMTVLPDRVVDAVLDEVHRTRQRAVLGPWRTRPMLRIGWAAAAVVAVVIGGGALLGAFRVPLGQGGPSATPGATQAVTPSPTSSSLPTPAPATFPGTGSRVTLTNGKIYQARSFTQLMTLTMPIVAAELGPEAVATGVTYGGFNTMQITYSPIEPTVDDRGIAITIHDDAHLDRNLCRPDGELQEIPATPEAIGVWLHEQAPGRGTGGVPNVVTDRPDIIVDGRVAKVFDVSLGSDCDDTGSRGDVSTYSNQSHRFYAIPTGTDTILVINWNQPGVLPQETVNAISDRLVASFRFE